MKIYNILLLYLIIIFNLCLYGQDADIFTSTRNGDWDDTNPITTPWIYNGTDSDGIPDSDDTVVIGHSVTCPGAYTNIGVIRVNASGSLLLDPNYFLQIFGQYQTSTIDGNITGPGLLRFALSHTFTGTGSVNNTSIKVNNWYCYFDLDMTLNQIECQSGGGFELSSGNTLTINGSVTKKGSANKIENFGTFIINDPNFMTAFEAPEDEFFSASGDLVYNATGDIPIPFDGGYNNFTLNGTATYNNDFSISGNFTNNGTLNYSNTPTVTLNGSSAQTFSGNGNSDFYNIILNNTNGISLNQGSLSISNAFSTSNGTITQNGANITLQSNSDNSSGLFKLNSSSDYSYISGNFTAERYYNGTSDGWRMVASPIKNSTLSDWDDEFIFCGIAGGVGNFSYSGCGNFYSVYSYNESNATPTIDDGLSEVTSLGFNISNATGTLIYTSSGATTISVTGNPEFDDISKSVTSNNAGWNLVANPYPSTIDWTAFTATNSNITGNVWYAYSADAVQYFSSSANIPHSQGFWINSNSSTNLNFSVSETSLNQANFVKSNNGINLPLKLKLTNNVNSYYDYAYLISGPNYSNNFDLNADALKFFTPYPNYNANVFFIDNQGNFLDRSCINNNQSEVILLNVNIGQYVPGNYTLNFENLEQFMIGSCLQLEDLHNGIFTDLRVDSAYTFSSDTNAPYPRFKLHINVDYDINVVNSVCYGDSSASVGLIGPNLLGSYFNLVDSLGDTIKTVIASSDTISFDNVKAGIYNLQTNHMGTCQVNNQNIHVVEPNEVISQFSMVSDTLYFNSANPISVYFRNNSSGANYYNWSFGNGDFSNDIHATHIYDTEGEYNVTLIATNDSLGTCSSTQQKTLTLIDNFSTPVNSNLDEFVSEIKLYNGFIYFDYNCENNQISVYDLTGKLVMRKNNVCYLDVSKIKFGNYFINIKSNDQEYTKHMLLN